MFCPYHCTQIFQNLYNIDLVKILFRSPKFKQQSAPILAVACEPRQRPFEVAFKVGAKVIFGCILHTLISFTIKIK